MLEKKIEQKLVNEVRKKGGLAVKLGCVGFVGIPDRLILMKNSKVAFVELKQKGKKPRPIQEKRINQLRELGFKCFVIDDINQIGGILDEIEFT